MTVFLEFVADNARYIYGLVAVIALILLRAALINRRERRAAIFPLEREVALSRTYRLLGMAILLALIMLGAWAAGRYLLPNLAQVGPGVTPSPDILVLIDTPSPTPPPPTATPTVTPTPRPRPTRQPPPAPATATPAVRPPACPNPGAAISSPGVGQIADGPLPVAGTASIEGFQFYKLEWQWQGDPGKWNWFGGSEVPAVGTVLGSFNPAGLPSGAYDIRLVVVDNTGNYPSPPCTVRVIVP